MSDTVVLVRHMPGERQDRVAESLARRGYRLETVWVADGQPLPEPEARHAGAVVYGGAQMASQSDRYDYLTAELRWIERWLAADKSYLGICLGAQMLARAAGARVAPHPGGLSEIGYVPIAPTAGRPDFVPPGLSVYHWHSEGFELPAGAELLARGPVFENQAFHLGAGSYGLQYHPEVTLEMMESWMAEAAHMLSLPGAHPAEVQRA
ncbi:MAG: glutamine amidotransferase, partial [Tistlia sp.]